ncbi:MAG: RecQ family ATP-dependent DNA helicase [Bacteroidetes bacterium QS_9_68_14]|nr:MAG: RecQ family ATP-dependent DNA helicase [Bacteroidetes bacterium QS_9_68_14]
MAQRAKLASSEQNTKEQAVAGRARALLERHWGHTAFRPGQAEAIAAARAGEDALVVLPTGGGKSVCYQVPALMMEGKRFALVVSPLIALMHDQVAALKARGIEAAFIDSTLSYRATEQRWTDAEHGRFDLLYVSPERLQSERFQARAGRLPVALLAVDEAHCVSMWGHHFRPDYRKIPEARAALGDPPTMAVTATAPPEVRRDMAEGLALRDPREVITGFDRPNLVWSVFQTAQKRRRLRAVVQGVGGAGLVYASTRRRVETYAAWLQGEGVAADYYHAGRDAEARAAVQADWQAGETRVVVATNAFGMGIDKADVRFVAHVDLPASLEAYYQQAGRAGRDGKRAHAVLLFQPSDAETRHALIESAHPTGREVNAVYTAVCNLGQVPLGSQPEVPLAIRPEAVEDLTGFSRGKVRSALQLLERAGAWTTRTSHPRFGLLRFEQPADALRRRARAMENRALAGFLSELLRTVHAEAFARWRDVDLRLLARRTGLARPRLQRGLAFLQEQGVLRWRPPGQALEVELLEPRTRAYPVDQQTVRRARRRAERRLRDVRRYARSLVCRRRFLLAHFGEAAPPRCGRCDVCLGRHETPVVTPSDEPALRHMLRAAERGQPREAWFDEYDGGEEPPVPKRDALCAWLVEQGYLRPADPLEEVFALTEKGTAFLAQVES